MLHSDWLLHRHVPGVRLRIALSYTLLCAFIQREELHLFADILGLN
jgi:hypothetical protein